MRILPAFVITAALALGQSAVLAPVAKQQFFDASGRPLAGGRLYTCAAATTCPGTPQTTYTDVTGAAAARNPIILDAGGRASIWLAKGLSYKFVLKTSADALVWMVDNFPDQVGDPGSNGVVFRSSRNVTRAATLADLTGLGLFALSPETAATDHLVLNFNHATGLLGTSGMWAYDGKINTGTNPTQFTFHEGPAPTAPLAGDWIWYADSAELSYKAKIKGNATTWYVGLFAAPGASGNVVLWDASGGFTDGGPAASPYPVIGTAAAGAPSTDAPLLWDVKSLPVVNGSVILDHTVVTRPLQMTNLRAGGFYTLVVVQDATGGATLTGGTGCTWMIPGGTGTHIFPLVTTTNAVDVLTFTFDGTVCFVQHSNFSAM